MQGTGRFKTYLTGMSSFFPLLSLLQCVCLHRVNRNRHFSLWKMDVKNHGCSHPCSLAAFWLMSVLISFPVNHLLTHFSRAAYVYCNGSFDKKRRNMFFCLSDMRLYCGDHREFVCCGGEEDASKYVSWCNRRGSSCFVFPNICALLSLNCLWCETATACLQMASKLL